MKPGLSLLTLTLTLTLSACISADPAVVARAVEATLTAVPSRTPIVVVVTVAGPPVVIPTVTPEPSATATPENSPTPTATPTPEPPVALGQPIFRDDFTDPGQWNPSDDVAQRTAVEDGQLLITLKLADRFALTYNNTRRARDFYAAVRGSAAACAFRDRYGLLFRVQDGENYYQLEVDCDGRYRVAAVVEGTLTPLQDWTQHDGVQSGSGVTNILGVRAQGNSFEVFANDQLLLTFEDATYGEGGFGLYAGSGPQSSTFTAAFDDLNVWELK